MKELGEWGDGVGFAVVVWDGALVCLPGSGCVGFHSEAGGFARLKHDNIVDVCDLWRSEDGRLFISMELLRGVTMCAAMKFHRWIDDWTVVELMVEILSAIHKSHGPGLIHRDL